MKRYRIVFLAVLLLIFLLPVIYNYYASPCRVEKDCSSLNLSMGDMKQLEIREKDGTAGLIRLAAWFPGDPERAIEPVSGKWADTGILYVYGTMSLVMKAQVKSGTYDRTMGNRDCVITSGLSFALFGSTDTAGCRIAVKEGIYTVAAVIEDKDKLMMLPTQEGRAERAAFVFKDRTRIKDRLTSLGFTWN